MLPLSFLSYHLIWSLSFQFALYEVLSNENLLGNTGPSVIVVSSADVATEDWPLSIFVQMELTLNIGYISW